MNKYLLAAYLLTWAIHIGYLLYLSGKASQLRKEIKDLER